MLLFKYMNEDAALRTLEKADSIVLRFALPKTFNDPYELFLEPDRPLDDENTRAFYDYWVGQVIQTPVTCFSRRPESVVMWAHYAQTGTGLCLGFDDDALVKTFEACYLEDVVYSDNPGQVPADVIEFAFGTSKRPATRLPWQ